MPIAEHPVKNPLDRPDILRVLFHPRRTTGPVDGGDRFEEFRVAVDGDIAVGARFYPAGRHAATILFFHGNGEIVSDYDDIAPLFTRLGINFLAVDYRGYGISDGAPSVTAMMTDAHRLFYFTVDFLERRGVDGPLAIMGRSLGSASALELAASYDKWLDGLIIESGFAWTEPLLRLLGVDTARIGLDPSAGIANLANIRTFTGPTLIIHAEFDHIIPLSDGQALFDACTAADKELVVIPGANHNDIFMRGIDRYRDALGSAIEKMGRRPAKRIGASTV